MQSSRFIASKSCKIVTFFHTIIIRRPQSGRPKRYTCSHVSLLRPPQPKARGHGGRHFFKND
eukprot:UN15477